MEATYHLQNCYVLLPPKVLLHLRPKGCQQVVRVHDDVHKQVDDSDQGYMASWK
jgi:hypothetical protein